MKDTIKIAWRNLWRNRRRTFITAGSIFFAVFFAIFMRSFQLGTYGYMIEQSIESYTGYLQIQNPGYFDDPNIDNCFELDSELTSTIQSHENVKMVVPRIESFALASTGTLSKGVLVSGIDPEGEKLVSNPEHRLVRYRFTEEAIQKMKQENLPADIMAKIEINKTKSYSSIAKIELDLEFDNERSKMYMDKITRNSAFKSSYLSQNDDGVLLSDRLSKYLKATVGDTVILIGQGYHGMSAAGVYPVRGIVKLNSPDLDNKLIYMSIEQASIFLGIENQATSMVIGLNDTDGMLETQTELQAKLDESVFTVKNWEEMVPTLKQQIEGDQVGGLIFVFILYTVIFFGIFGTLLMMMAERKREFGVMMAIGMKAKKLTRIVTFEMIFIGLLGILAGMAVVTPILLYGHYNPIQVSGDMGRMYEDMGFDPVMPMALFDPYYFNQGIIVFAMILLACWVTLRSIKKMNVIEALRG